MKSFDSRTYNVADFVEWRNAGLLQISPDFQRRSVWSENAKSYLIDTIVRGKPMHKVFITQSLKSGRSLRTVVDGQQRLRAILGFIDGDFAISRVHNAALAGTKYEDLEEDVKTDFLQYEIAVDLLFDMSLADTLDVFARLNTYSVKLNPTELLNATFLGSFKTASHQLGHTYAEYWLDSRVLTKAKVTRMAEVELASDLLGATLDGIVPKKSIPALYKKYDERQEDVEGAVGDFDRTMSAIGEIYSPEDLSGTNFARVHLFYSLFVSISNVVNGRPTIPSVPSAALMERFRPSRFRVVLDDISAKYDAMTSSETGNQSSDPELSAFIDASRRATTDQATREIRSKYLSRRLLDAE